MVKVTSLIVKAGSGLRFSFGVRALTEMEIRCVKGMHRLKLVSCENNSGFKGPSVQTVYHRGLIGGASGVCLLGLLDEDDHQAE